MLRSWKFKGRIYGLQKQRVCPCIESEPALRCIDEMRVDENIDEQLTEASKISHDKGSERVTLDFPSEILPIPSATRDQLHGNPEQQHGWLLSVEVQMSYPTASVEQYAREISRRREGQEWVQSRVFQENAGHEYIRKVFKSHHIFGH